MTNNHHKDHHHDHHGSHEEHHHQHEQHHHQHEENDTHAHHGQGSHGGHGHHNHGDMVEDFKKRFYISLIVTIPILSLSPMIQSFLGVDWQLPYNQYILFVLSTFI